MARLIFKAPYYKPKGKVNRGGYAKYIATREGVELLRSGMADYINERRGSNGLFSDEGVVINLAQIEETINNHAGNVWGLIFSLKRADAERFGYNSAEQWMNLLRSHRNDIAKEMHIAPGDLRWYAAYHNNETHPHVHMLVWSERAHEPYLSKVGIQNIKRTVANDIFKRDLIPIYKKQTQARDNIKASFRSRIDKLMSEIGNMSIDYNSEIALKFQMLSQRISKHKGKKVYGYLDKETKKLVDEIVKMIAADEKISELYDLWHKCRCETFRTYTDAMLEKIPLEENEEFKSIRNEVVKMASELKVEYVFQGQDDTEPSHDFEEEDIDNLEERVEEDEDPFTMYKLGKKYLDEEHNPEEAMKYFKRAADGNNAYAAYAYGKMCADRGDINKAKIYFGRATRVKPELGFRVGMWYYYDLGNHEMGIGHLENAAKNGNVAAEEALNAINRGIDTRLAWGVLNLFRHASRVIDDRAKAHVKISPMQGVDRKLRQRIREKKEEQGLRMSM